MASTRETNSGLLFCIVLAHATANATGLAFFSLDEESFFLVMRTPYAAFTGLPMVSFTKTDFMQGSVTFAFTFS